MKILTDAGIKALCDCVPKSLKRYSKHNIEITDDLHINNYNWDDYDIVHTNGTYYPQFFTTKAKLIYNIHTYILTCPSGGFFCSILNRLLDNPLTCVNCLGYLGIKTGGDNLSMYVKMARKSNILAVHSEFLKDFYHTYNPTVFKVPLETDILVPCDKSEKEDYLLYTGRLSFEKNPYGFIDIINKTGLKGKMVVYHFINEDIISTKKYYKDILEMKNKNIELILNPTKEEMIKYVQRAKFTVLPYFFAEPLGVAALNSILCGTPLISFPYGNARNLATLLPRTLNEMISMLNPTDDGYNKIILKLNSKRIEVRKEHDQRNVVEQWDNIYSKLGDESS